MRVAALYDIHGNLPALAAVLAAVEDEGVDRIVIGGDVVPGPLSSFGARPTTSRPRSLKCAPAAIPARTSYSATR
jgi:Icc-related predicted phosphoesterase